MPDETDNKCRGVQGNVMLGITLQWKGVGRQKLEYSCAYSLKAMETEITSGCSDHLAPQKLFFTFL